MDITQWPWERNRNPCFVISDDLDTSYGPDPKFCSVRYENNYLDCYTKVAAIKVSASVVSIVTYTDNKEITQGTGTIIEKDGTLLTSAKLIRCRSGEEVVAKNLKVIVHLGDGKSYEAQVLAHDFYYGIAVLKIQEDVPLLKPARLRLVDDCVLLDQRELLDHDDKKYLLRPHPNIYNLVPGTKVIALGRYFKKPYDLMAAPGEFSIQRFNNHRCKEAFRATCVITDSGMGGPLINCGGEVIGINLYDLGLTPFIPINIALKWWEHCKKYGDQCRWPLRGIELASLYTVLTTILEKFLLKFPDNVGGVVVEKVEQGSSADVAGLRPNDLIVECCGKPVHSYLKLSDMIWDNVEDYVDLLVLRVIDNDSLHLTMEIVNATWRNKQTTS